MNLKNKIGASIASSALVAQFLVPTAFADTAVVISGNGSNTDNTAHFENNTETTVSQSNELAIGVDIAANANSGGNEANNNTGTNANVSSGNATAAGGVLVEGGSNEASLNCGCDAQGTSVVAVEGNGSGSNNMAHLMSSNSFSLTQNQAALIGASLQTNASSGMNSSNNNTGGSTHITGGGSTALAGFGFKMLNNMFSMNP